MSTHPSDMWHSPAAPGHREPRLVIAPKSEGGWSKVPGGFLGRGQFGEVWRARDHRSGREFAVKQVPCRGLQGPSQEIVDFQHEAELLMRLDHPHILPCFGVDQDEDYHYAFLELLDTSLSSCCHGEGGGEPRPMEEITVRRYTRQMLLALEYLHGFSIMHRDLKPRNVLLDCARGCVKLADFGEAKQLRDGLEGLENTQGRGTPLYTPPEVVSSGQYDERADIWCLGCTVIEMLTGELPWLERDPVTGAKTAPFLDSFGRPNLERMMLHIGEGCNTPVVPDSLSDKARGFLAYCFQLQPDRRPSAAKLLSHLFVDEDDIKADSTGEAAARSMSGPRTGAAPALDGARFATPTPQGAAGGGAPSSPPAPGAAPPVCSPGQGPPSLPPKDTESPVSLLSGSWHSEPEFLWSSGASILPQASPRGAVQGSWGEAAGQRGPGSPAGSLMGEGKTPRGVPAPSTSSRPLSPSGLCTSSASSRPHPSPQSHVRRSGPIIPLEKLGMGKLQGSVSTGAALQGYGSRPGSGSGSGRPQSPLEQGRVASEPGRAPSSARALPPRGPASSSSGLFRRAQMGGLAPSRAPESFSDSDEDKEEEVSDQGEGEEEQGERRREKGEALVGTAHDSATSSSRSSHTPPRVASSGASPSLSGDGSPGSGVPRVAHSRALPPCSHPVQHVPPDGSGMGGGRGGAWSSGSMEGGPPGRGTVGAQSGPAAVWGQDLQESGTRRLHPAADSPVGALSAGLHAVSLDQRRAGPLENGPDGMNSPGQGRAPVLARPLLPSERRAPLLPPSPFPLGSSEQSAGGAGGAAPSPGHYYEMHHSHQGQQFSGRHAAGDPVPPPPPLLPFRSLPVPCHTLPSPGGSLSLAGAGKGGGQQRAGSASSTWALTATGSASAGSGLAVQGMPFRGQRPFHGLGARPGIEGAPPPPVASPRNSGQGVHPGGLPQDGQGAHTWGRPSSRGLPAATRGHSISSPEAALSQTPSEASALPSRPSRAWSPPVPGEEREYSGMSLGPSDPVSLLP